MTSKDYEGGIPPNQQKAFSEACEMLDGLNPSMRYMLLRIITDKRMKNVWTELEKHKCMGENIFVDIIKAKMRSIEPSEDFSNNTILELRNVAEGLERLAITTDTRPKALRESAKILTELKGSSEFKNKQAKAIARNLAKLFRERSGIALYTTIATIVNVMLERDDITARQARTWVCRKL